MFTKSALADPDIVPKKYTAIERLTPVVIDGNPDEFAWRSAMIADNFSQLDPTEGANASQRSEVRVIYDNSALYVSAILFDLHSDSILYQLGNRDQSDDLNSDAFRIGIDPYNKRQGSYVFEVSASGVQSESFNGDISFDAVWESSVTHGNFGWAVEIKIPYSAIRFPTTPEQVWGVQFARSIRRNREYDQWTLTPKKASNSLLYWGTMDGIKNIKPPLRLSVTPYLAYYTEWAPEETTTSGTRYKNSYSYSGGADLKYGIDERFTIDMTLLPDFSQVQSDNKIKNLSAFETFYEENRPFFKEGTSLFNLGGLFYSRRIGKTPSLFKSVTDSLNEGDELKENPDKAKLVNAVKVSGRTNQGLGIGLLNAVNKNTYAVIQHSDGSIHKIITEPLTNFNLLVFDQQLKNNSRFFLVNTNVTRNGSSRDANVTKGEFRFENAKHQYRLRGQYSLSNVHDPENNGNKNILGSYYLFSADKTSGTSWYGVNGEITDKNYDKNDFGFLSLRDFTALHTYYSYNFFNPFLRYFRRGNVTLFLNRNGKLSKNDQLTGLNAGFNIFLLFMNNWSFYAEVGGDLSEGRDYYEPRIPGRFFYSPKWQNNFFYITTNYNRKLAFDFGGYYTHAFLISTYTGKGYFITSRFRVNDHLNFRLENRYDASENDIGFATTNDIDTSIFGRRSVHTITNSIGSTYIFKNDMSLSLTARHYWSNGRYDSFYLLRQDGRFDPYSTTDTQSYDFNSNYFTVDITYNWQFAPGSSLLFTYKNMVNTDAGYYSRNYFKNINDVLSSPQTNSISLKVLYYLDYQYLARKK